MASRAARRLASETAVADAAPKKARQITPADLTRLGFVQDKIWERRTGPRPDWFVKGCVRVVLNYEDSENGNVGVFGFDETYGKGTEAVRRGCLAWECRFDGCTPAAIVLAAIHHAVEGSL